MFENRIRQAVTGTLLGGALMMAGPAAYAFSAADLPTGFVEFKYTNWETLNPDDGVATGPSNASGTYLGDSFAIFKVSNIQDINAVSTWQDGDNGEELTGVLWGFDVQAVDAVNGTAQAVGGRLAVFSNVSGTFDVNPGGNGPGNMIGNTSIVNANATGIDIPNFDTITGGTLLFIAEYDTGIVDNTIWTLDSDGNFAANPPVGQASGYANIVADSGSIANKLDTDTFDVIDETNTADTRDLFLQSDFNTNASQSWPLRSQDPVQGNVVPEPASLVLLGLGLAGIGGAGVARRRRRG